MDESTKEALVRLKAMKALRDVLREGSQADID
jgi:hypothetical protein